VSIVTVEPVAIEQAQPLAFDVVFHDHYRTLVRLLSPIGPGADDAVQEAFALALVRWRRVGSYDDPVAWIRKVAVHRLLNERRRLRRRTAALPRLVEPATVDDGTAGVVPELARAIRALPVRQRTALTLKVLGDLDTAEVAAAMGITEGAVRYHLHEARTRMRAALGDDHDP
jgi:RNA polymerase sigma-70 factor (ECF subfamily)